MANVYKRYLTLQGRAPVRLVDVSEYSYTASSFTATTILKFERYDGATILAQGDKVISILLIPAFSFRQWLRKFFKRAK